MIIYSCAKVTVSPVDNDHPYTQGIRFYRPHPYLLVTETLETLDRRTLEGKIIYLPQKKEEYVIQVQSGLGKVDVKLKLEHGWRLTDFGEVRDSKTPETIEAFSDFLPAAGDILVKSFAPDKQLQENKLSPGLWRFEFDENGYVKGLLKIIEFEKQ